MTCDTNNPLHSKKTRALLAQAMSASALAIIIGLNATPSHADGPTISAPNAELSLLGEIREDEGGFLAEGAVTVPLSPQVGARLSGIAGSVDSEFAGGGTVHLFTRDPDQYLLGITGGYLSAPNGDDRNDIGFVGVEGEAYFGDFTISGLAGAQFQENRDDDFLGRLDLDWYATDDLLLSIGAETNAEQDIVGRVGAEHLIGVEALPGLSVFAEAELGDDDYYRVGAGVKVYIGPSPTLKSKHRRDTFRSYRLPIQIVSQPASKSTSPPPTDPAPMPPPPVAPPTVMPPPLTETDEPIPL